MRCRNKTPGATPILILSITTLASGCVHDRFAARQSHPLPAPPASLGALSDAIWANQEVNAEASDFVVHQHEFGLNNAQLNTSGQDHVRQIAMRLHSSQDVPVIVQRSMTTARDSTEFKYPVHPNSELDMRRREIVARSLVAMGVAGADERVVVAPALTPGASAAEARDAYERSFQQSGFFGGGFGGGAFSAFSGLGGGGTAGGGGIF